MENSFTSCPHPANTFKTWPYRRYYHGKQDQEKRRNGDGENHWSGAESLEWYTGKFVRDVMHGDGEYRWRYLGHEGAFITYEGRFYGNRMHGYGVMSYPGGRVFNGLFYHDIRWGPGVESHSDLQENVGFWRGNQLLRLVWRPNAPSVTLDLNSGPAAKICVEPYRSLLTTRIKTIGEVNSSIELLKQSGADPILASENWSKLYPKYCTDLASQLCHNELFDYEYYKNNIFELEEVDIMPETLQDQNVTDDARLKSKTFYAWNNSVMMIGMMKHCFKHEKQRRRSGIDLRTILTGPRNRYKRAAKHEIECRTLILASYLGKVKNVVQLVNENNVHPDVADVLGNTALMYATCGNQTDIIHFLVEAGAYVNSFNDSCCTPLGVALVKYMCACKDIPTSGMIQALLPPSSTSADISPKSLVQKPSEWHITRDFSEQSAERLTAPSKVISLKKANKSKMQLDTWPKERKRSNTTNEARLLKDRRKNNTSTNTFVTETLDEPVDVTEQTNEQRLLDDINQEFSMKVTDLFTSKTAMNPVPYLFEVTDMVKATDMIKDHRFSINGHPKPLVASKSAKEATMKLTKDVTRQVSEKDSTSEHSADQAKIAMLSDNMSTILQLLSDGADPRLTRCPQPALRMALASGSSDLLRLLVKHGADVNEAYPNESNLTLLDMAISQPLTYESLAQIKAILECGATADHRLEYPTANNPKVPVPTLLHAVLAKNAENYMEAEVRCQLLQLLLEYNCDPLAQFKGCSAIDVSMKDMSLFDVFVKSPKVDLNAIINDQNQTILVKMFSPHFCSRVPISERLQILTSLMLYAADPLLECQDGDKKYANFFVFAKQHPKTISDTTKPITNGKIDVKGKKRNEKAKELNEKQSKPAAKLDDTKDFKQALDLVNNCTRILHVRWIHANLLKNLIEVVTKYEHRHWNMILPEYRNKKACGLWLSTPRALEIWDIFKSNKKKNINDRRILKHVLCIVHFNCNRSKTTFKTPVTAEERGMIENDVCCLLREYKAACMATEPIHLAKPYVTPELAAGADIKFQVCFECHLPFEEEKIQCENCKQISFCSHACMKMNVGINTGSHPCGEYLKTKYFSNPESFTNS